MKEVIEIKNKWLETSTKNYEFFGSFLLYLIVKTKSRPGTSNL